MVLRGPDVQAGAMVEPVPTTFVDLHGLSRGTRLELGETAVVEITGLRNPCTQINGLSEGLMKELVHLDDAGATVRLAGVMSVVLEGGVVRPGDGIRVIPPAGRHEPLQPV
jgi:MOSC domain-containing protein YiiM